MSEFGLFQVRESIRIDMRDMHHTEGLRTLASISVNWVLLNNATKVEEKRF